MGGRSLRTLPRRLVVAPAAPPGRHQPARLHVRDPARESPRGRTCSSSATAGRRGPRVLRRRLLRGVRDGTLPTLERRVNDSIAGVAAFIIGAWEQAGRPALPTGREPRTPQPHSPSQSMMDVFLVPIGRDRFEPYYERGGRRGAGRSHAAPAGLFARMRARFSQQLARGRTGSGTSAARAKPETLMARLQRKMMRWIAERVAEQRLLWHLGRAKRRPCTCPTNLDARWPPVDARFDAARRRSSSAPARWSNAGAAVSIPVARFPVPMSSATSSPSPWSGISWRWRGARRGLTAVPGR